MNGPTFATRADAPHAHPAAHHAPRAATPRQAAKPSVPPGGDAAAGLRALTYLRLHWLLILFCGTLVGGGLGYGAWSLLPSKYESTAILHVSSAPVSIASQGNKEQARTDFVTFVKTQAALLKSEFVLNAALRTMRDVGTVRDQKDPIKYLDEEVTVNWKDGSEVIYISFKGHEPNDVKAVVDSVQAAFVAEVVQKELDEKRQFHAKVELQMQEMQKRLEAKNSRPPGSRAASGVVPAGATTPAPGSPPAPLVVDGAVPLAPPAVVLAAPESIENKLGKLDPRYVIQDVVQLRQEVERRLPLAVREAERKAQAAAAKLDALKKAPADPAAVQAVEAAPDVLAQVKRVSFVRKRYEVMAHAGSENAPGVLSLKADWEAEEKALDALKREKLLTFENLRRSDEARKLVAEGADAVETLRRLKEQEAMTRSQLDRAERLLRDIPDPQLRLAAALNPDDPFAGGPQYSGPAQTQVSTEDGIYSALVRQHTLTKMDIQSPPRVHVLQKASQPVQKDGKKQVIATVAACLFGYALIAVGVVGFETLSRRVSSLADLKTAGPAPVVGVIPCLPGEAGRDPAKRAAANESIDKLRSYVAQTWLARGAATVAVTSATGDEGKSFTAFGLASSLAQSGYRTLVVDFDLRDPVLHDYAGVANEAGVCEVLRGEADARRSVQFLPSGLHLLPAGKWSDEARKAAVGGRLDAVLTRLKEPYDCVVIHGHALLTAAESVEVARRCEAVLVCARYRETRTPLLRKATDRVAAMEIPYSGVVYVGATESEALC